MTDQDLGVLLRFDSLHAAEQLTGVSYKEDDSTIWLGMALMQENGKLKDAALRARNDTLFSNDLDRYVEIIESYGFAQVLDVPFAKDDRAEHFFIYWHPDGLLLKFDTYGESRVNGGKVYYNWRPAAEKWDWRLTSSGHGRENGVWVGDHDCREALIFNLENLRANGEFVTPWVERPFLWLLHYGDEDARERYEEITAARLALLPEQVREAIGDE